MNEKIEVSGSDLVLVARQASRTSFVLGIVLVSLGVFAVFAPLFTGIAATVLVGMLLIAGGIAETIFAFKAPSFGKGVLTFLFGGLSVVVGIAMLFFPGRGLGALTVLLAAYFVAAGIVDIVLAIKLRPENGWGWALFSGIISVVLGGFIVWQWPVSGIWAVGVYVGVRLLLHGWALVAMGIASRDAMAVLQNRRLEMLEDHVRAGAGALQQTQVALAAHTAVLAALDKELHKKVSTEEVDPAIRELNQKLGEARNQMQHAADLGAEAWNEVQTEARKTFDALQRSTTELAERLGRELGIDKN